MRWITETPPLFILLIIAALTPGTGAAQDVASVIAKNLAARGGVEKLRSLNTVKITGTIAVTMVERPGAEPRKMELPMTTWAKRPNKMRRDQTFPDRTVSIGFDGETAWIFDPALGVARPTAGPQAEATRDDATFDPLFLTYAERGHEIELVGTDTLDGVAVHHLRVTKKNGQVEHHYLRADTGLEYRMVTTVVLEPPPGEPRLPGGSQKIEVRTDLFDYRTVDGMQVAFGMRQLRNGEEVLQVKLERVEFDVPIDDGIFRMPEKESGTAQK